jgi:hypothetical protein
LKKNFQVRERIPLSALVPAHMAAPLPGDAARGLTGSVTIPASRPVTSPPRRFRTIANSGDFHRPIRHMRFPAQTRESPHFRASTRLIVKHFFGLRAAGSAGWSCRPSWCSSAWGTPRSPSPWTSTAIYSRAAMTVPSWRRPRRLCSRSRAESSRSLSLINRDW